MRAVCCAGQGQIFMYHSTFYQVHTSRLFLFLISIWLHWVFAGHAELSLVEVRQVLSPIENTGSRPYMGLVALQHVGSSQTRDQTCVPCLKVLNHQTTREAPYVTSLICQHQVLRSPYIYIFWNCQNENDRDLACPQRTSHDWVTEHTYKLLSLKPFKNFLPKFFTPNPMVSFFEMVEKNEVK